jgi:hypothetical protein
MTLLLICVLGFVVFSLGQAMFAMDRGPDASGAMVRALTRRIGVSVLLFALLMLGWKLGWIHPHGVG